jgi:hypothetical protein
MSLQNPVTPPGIDPGTVTRIIGTLNKGLYTLMLYRRILRMRNVSDKSWRENKNRRFIVNNFFFLSSENGAVCEIMCKNNGRTGQATYANKIQRLCLATWITKAT